MQRDYHELWGGGVLTLLGLAVAGYAGANYDFGTLRQMGPGFFPVVLGVVLAGLGLLVLVPALTTRQGEEPAAIHWTEAAATLAAILLFALLLNRLGLVVATALAALVASLPAPWPGVLWRLVLTLVITLITWAIFIQGLSMAIPLWPWSR